MGPPSLQSLCLPKNIELNRRYVLLGRASPLHGVKPSALRLIKQSNKYNGEYYRLAFDVRHSSSHSLLFHSVERVIKYIYFHLISPMRAHVDGGTDEMLQNPKKVPPTVVWSHLLVLQSRYDFCTRAFVTSSLHLRCT